MKPGWRLCPSSSLCTFPFLGGMMSQLASRKFFETLKISPALLIETFISCHVTFCLEAGFALWGCYNKIPHTGWLINYKHLFFTVLVAGRPKSECQHGWVRALLWVADYQFLPVSSQEEARRALIPFTRDPPSLPKHLPRLHILIPSHWVLGF